MSGLNVIMIGDLYQAPPIQDLNFQTKINELITLE
jgi:hypothetical protein